jgi:orotate phosphoribosyltransferase
MEEHRGPTEAWLARRGIRTRRLIMASSVEEHVHPATFKAAEYAKLGADLYLESDPRQAAEIALLTNKRVICPPSGEVFN